MKCVLPVERLTAQVPGEVLLEGEGARGGVLEVPEGRLQLVVAILRLGQGHDLLHRGIDVQYGAVGLLREMVR